MQSVHISNRPFGPRLRRALAALIAVVAAIAVATPLLPIDSLVDKAGAAASTGALDINVFNDAGDGEKGTIDFIRYTIDSSSSLPASTAVAACQHRPPSAPH
jgi:hypothetical protein